MTAISTRSGKRAFSASATVRLSWPDLAEALAGSVTLGALLEGGRASIEGDAAAVRAALASYDTPGLRR